MAMITKKKTVASILAALMLASMALPASAADLNIDNGSGGNTTEVTLNYLEDVDPSIDENAFTITVPAQIDLQAEQNGNDGVTITNKDGTSPSIDFSGAIGQNDKVVLNVSSENKYHLMDGSTEVAGYSVDFTTKEDNGIDIQTQQVKTDDESKTISWNYAKAFQGEASIDMTFANDGANTIFGKGEYKDTLTFDYEYESAGSVIKCNGEKGTLELPVNNDGYVDCEALLKSYADTIVDGEREVEIRILGENTGDTTFYTYSYEVKDGQIVESSEQYNVTTYQETPFNYKNARADNYKVNLVTIYSNNSYYFTIEDNGITEYDQ